MVGKKYKGRI